MKVKVVRNTVTRYETTNKKGITTIHYGYSLYGDFISEVFSIQDRTVGGAHQTCFLVYDPVRGFVWVPMDEVYGDDNGDGRLHHAVTLWDDEDGDLSEEDDEDY